MNLTATVKRANPGTATFEQVWRGVLVDEGGSTVWNCGHSHTTIIGNKSAMDCAVFELARRNETPQSISE